MAVSLTIITKAPGVPVWWIEVEHIEEKGEKGEEKKRKERKEKRRRRRKTIVVHVLICIYIRADSRITKSPAGAFINAFST